jgi:NAD(P)H-hydrate epimerase
VLAVDIPSGVDGLTGVASERVLAAERTVTFAALKPGLLLGGGRELAGEIEVVDIGLDVSEASAWLITDDDVTAVLPPRPIDAHKWKAAVWIAAALPA